MEERERLGYLDSIRGIAAFIVVLGHCWLMNPSDFRTAPHGLTTAFVSVRSFLFYIAVKFFEAGRSSVLVFFVLSGFVLAYSLIKRHTPYAGYTVRRVFRIYPAFLFVVLASFVLHRWIGIRHDVASDWLRVEINPNLSFVFLLKCLALIGTTGSTNLDGVVWTLVHEMRISVIFPFILFSVKRYRWRSILFYWLVSIVCTWWILHTTGSFTKGYGEVTFMRTFLNTGYFIIFFVGGAFLAIDRNRVALKIADLATWKKAFLFACVIYCLLKSDYDLHPFMGVIADYMHGFGALGLIALALGVKKFAHALSHNFPIWLGRISYSLYLVHLPIIYVVNQTIGKSWSVLQTSIVVIPLSILAAELTARAIEFPSIKLGKKLISKTK